MEHVWVRDRMRLYELRREHPTWSQRRLAHELERSLSWVKKWLRRFQEASHITLETFRSQSRAPKTRPNQIAQRVRKAILQLRDTLAEVYWLRPGQKRILYHLHEDTTLEASGYRLPTSPTTVWKILKAGGRILTRVPVQPMTLPRPAPMDEWEIDFGEARLNKTEKLEFLPVVDRGTSIMVDLVGSGGYNAETSLLAVAQILLRHGCPKRIRMDNDTRFVWSWNSGRYPSALVQFLNTLGVEVVLCDPGKPWQKPYVERVVGTVKHEFLAKYQPTNLQVSLELLETYPQFYNTKRPNQTRVCNNVPLHRAFPLLPLLPSVPNEVEPDAWLKMHHNHNFKRHVTTNGSVKIGKYSYYVGSQFVKQQIAARLDAQSRVFHFLLEGKLVKTLPIKGLLGGQMDFQDYLKHMLKQAVSEQRQREQDKRRKR